MLVRPVGKKQPLQRNRGFLVGQKSLSSQSTFGPKRWNVVDGSFRRPTRTSSQHHISSARVFQQNPPAVVLIGATSLIAMCLTIGDHPVCTVNPIRVDDVMESPKLAE
jgi:hypothetical protein